MCMVMKEKQPRWPRSLQNFLSSPFYSIHSFHFYFKFRLKLLLHSAGFFSYLWKPFHLLPSDWSPIWNCRRNPLPLNTGHRCWPPPLASLSFYLKTSTVQLFHFSSALFDILTFKSIRGANLNLKAKYREIINRKEPTKKLKPLLI